MRVVVINPILYTSETPNIKKVESIKDTMIYNLCLEIKRQGHEPILIAAEDFKPKNIENYDFKIIFLKTRLHKIFKPNCFPLMKGLEKALKDECGKFDVIISSEVFMMSSLYVSMKYKNRTIIWHELAKHNNIMKKIPSKIWYNIISRLFFHNTRIVARSKNAQEFIRKYCNNVSENYIDHGVNLNEFTTSPKKKNQFVVISQLIYRKHIDGIIKIFSKFIKKENESYKLIIIGSGEKLDELKKVVKNEKIAENVVFEGQLNHDKMVPILSKSKALLINTEKDNSMLSIVEAIATATPIVTTDVPYNCDYIIKNKLGIVEKCWSEKELKKIVQNNELYVQNCMKYRNKVSNQYVIEQFENEIKKLKSKKNQQYKM